MGMGSGRALHHHARAGNLQHLARCGTARRHRADGYFLGAALGAQRRKGGGLEGTGRGGRRHGGVRAGKRHLRPLRGPGAPEPAGLLRRRGRGLRVRRRAHCLCLRPGHARLSGPSHGHRPARDRRAHGRRHVPPHPAGRSAVRLPGAADRDDGHGARHGGFSRGPARPCARRPVLCACGGHVPGLGHLGLQGGRHGGRGSGPVPRNAQARRGRRRSGGPAVGHGRADGNRAAQPGADHHRLGHGRVHCSAVHGRTAAGAGPGPVAVCGRLVALAP